MSHRIRKVAVLGAGTMGAAIAAHCANAGLEVDLLDIAPDDDDKNAVVRPASRGCRTPGRPRSWARTWLTGSGSGTSRTHFERVGEADWIVEAIIEKLEPKRELMQRVEDTAKEDAIISTNTSGIPLHRSPRAGPRSSKAFRRHPLLQPAALLEAHGDHTYRGHGPRDRRGR